MDKDAVVAFISIFPIPALISVVLCILKITNSVDISWLCVAFPVVMTIAAILLILVIFGLFKWVEIVGNWYDNR